MQKAFKAYDIRGVFNRDFNLDDVYRIGFFLPRLLHTDQVLVGRDVRTSSDAIFQALAEGITDSGSDVYNLGLTTTPMVYWATARLGFSASVQITASHNPKEYNGLKVSRQFALPVGMDTGLGDLLQMAMNQQIKKSSTKGKIHKIEIHEQYISFINEHRPDFSHLRIAVDCSNGMAALFARDMLGNSPLYLYDQPDGTFPNHEPNPLDENNVEDLKKLVAKENCDIGIIFDGDADRVMFVDDRGRFIRPDIMIALLGDYFAKHGRFGHVVIDIRTSKSVENYLKKSGFTTHLWKVGRAFAALKLRELDAVFGGELAGHYYFKDFYFSDSAFLAVMFMLEVIVDKHNKGMALSEWVDHINAGFVNSGEINFRVEDKTGAMKAIKEHFIKQATPVKLLDFDGYRIEFDDWWFNIRPSNTEPYLRFLAEARSAEILEKHLNAVKKIIRNFGE